MALFEFSCAAIVARLRSSQATLVHAMTFAVGEGHSLALVGETGSGKTIVALAIMGLLPSNVSLREGHAVLDGRDLCACSHRELRGLLGSSVVYVPQSGGEFLSPSRKVGAHLTDTLKRLGVPRAQRRERARAQLAAAGLGQPDQVMDAYPFQLSGGMAQRVAIALAACSERARLVIADEPTNGLDQAASTAFADAMSQTFPRAARLIITHDVALARRCDETLVMCRGHLMEQGPSRCVLTHPRHPYTRAMLGALVCNGMHETPVLRQGEAVCPFYRRCSCAAQACLTAMAHHVDGACEWWCSANDAARLRTA